MNNVPHLYGSMLSLLLADAASMYKLSLSLLLYIFLRFFSFCFIFFYTHKNGLHSIKIGTKEAPLKMRIKTHFYC